MKGKVGKQYGVRAIPFKVMVDQTGRVAHVHVGYTEDGLYGIIAEINALLQAQQQARVASARSAP
jgi:hypothetical protein